MVKELRFDDRDYNRLHNRMKDMFMEDQTKDDNLRKQVIAESSTFNGVTYWYQIEIQHGER